MMTNTQSKVAAKDYKIYGGSIPVRSDSINLHPDSSAPLLAVERYVYLYLSNKIKSSRPPLNKMAVVKNKNLDIILRPDLRLSEGCVFDDRCMEFLRVQIKGRFGI